jgi:hypothetical protein
MKLINKAENILQIKKKTIKQKLYAKCVFISFLYHFSKSIMLLKLYMRVLVIQQYPASF